MKNKGQASNMLSMGGYLVVGILIIVGGLYAAKMLDILPGGVAPVPVDDDDEPIGPNTYAQVEVGFDFEPIDLDAQDSDSDYDHDIYEYTAEGNDNLVDKNYVDCSGATPVVWSGGSDTVVTVPDSATCVVNGYKFTQGWSSSPGAADIETKLKLEVNNIKADLQDFTVANNASTVYKLDNTKTYLVCSIDTSEVYDLIPECFLFELPKTTSLDTDAIAGGDVEVVFKRKHYSDAVDETRLTIGGECSDSEDNDVTLTSGLDGVLHSSLTTAVNNWDAECTVEVTVNKDGYALIMTNPLADGETEKAYAQFEPYGMNRNDTQNATWAKLVNTDTQTTFYTSTTPTTAGNYTIIESMVICGTEILDDDTTGSGSLVHANEKVRDAPCFEDLYDKNAAMEIDVTMTNVVSVDYDASTTANNTVLEANSGSSPEDIVDISVYSPLSSTDIVGQALSA